MSQTASSVSPKVLQYAAAQAPPLLPDRLLSAMDRHRRWLLGAVLLLYLLGFNGQWHVEPDTALYLTIARNLGEHKGYTYHGQVQNLAYPGWPLVIAGTFKFFETDVLWPAHVLMLLFALGALGLTYRLFLLHAGRPTAVAMTCMLGITENFYKYAFQLRNDMPFLLGVLAVLVGYEAIVGLNKEPDQPAHGPLRVQWYDWALLVGGVGVALVMRPVMLVFLPLATLFLCKAIYNTSLRRAWILVILMVAGAAVWILLMDPRRHGGGGGGYEEDVMQGVTTRLNETLGRTWEKNLPQMMRSVPRAAFGHELGPGINIIATAALLGLGIALLCWRGLWGLWVGATVVIVLLTEVVRDRYFLAILPLLAYGWWRGLLWVNRRLARPWGDWIFVPLLAVWVGINGVKVAKDIYEQRQVPFLSYYKAGRFPPLMQLAQQIRDRVPANAVVLAPQRLGRVLTYFSHRNVLDTWEWDCFQAKGLLAYIVMPPDDDDPNFAPFVRQRGLKVGSCIAKVDRSSDRGKSLPSYWTLHGLIVPGAQPGSN